ncbi:MAG: BMP family ABC transporter substrate-binding protein [Oscillospiraceae bacterium]|nr:BMP family ABC transporter substrate-binding protein [Oscillospiraceae bacterium]
MADISYQQARRLGLKELKLRSARHEYPYLPALEDELEHLNRHNEQLLGTFRIELDQVVGTYTASRGRAFSASFFPLLDESSEFAAKWSALAASHLKEGIREPIIAVEYLNRYYVVEGHKRVSVLRFFGALTVRAEVRRLLPARSREPRILAYYEFLDFYRVTQIQYIVFRTPGHYPALLGLLCGEDRSVWDGDRQRCFYSAVMRFRRSFRDSALSQKLTQDEALLRYLEIFGYSHLQDRTPAEIKSDLAAIAPELLSQAGDKRPVLMTDASEAPPSLIQRIVRTPLHDLKIAFLHDKDPGSSFWTWSHEQGRLAMQEALGDRVESVSCFNMLQGDPARTVRELAEQGYGMIFSTTPRLLPATLTAAAAWPEIRFLNCSLNVSHPIVRSYYGRMYEAKFLTGVIAGAMSSNSKIGYICNYPIFSMPASINAFALGARMVNPEAQIILEWTTVLDADIGGRFARDGVTAVSGSDSFTPALRDQELGVFVLRGGKRENVAYSLWDWGKLYSQLARSVLEGSWSELSSTSDAGQSINYFWGLASGLVDVRCLPTLPAATARLVALLRRDIAVGTLLPFAGPLYDQKGVCRVQADQVLTHEEILHMNWLLDNVVGSIPHSSQLSEEARDLVRLQGVSLPEDE